MERQDVDHHLQQSAVGTAEVARRHVRAYFQSLRDQLCAQEVAALTVVDTHLRERLRSIRQQEDMATLLSQVRGVTSVVDPDYLQDSDPEIIISDPDPASMTKMT